MYLEHILPPDSPIRNETFVDTMATVPQDQWTLPPHNLTHVEVVVLYRYLNGFEKAPWELPTTQR